MLIFKIFMTIVLILVLIALTFGFIFAKIDSLQKVCKKLQSEIMELQKNAKDTKNNS